MNFKRYLPPSLSPNIHIMKRKKTQPAFRKSIFLQFSKNSVFGVGIQSLLVYNKRKELMYVMKHNEAIIMNVGHCLGPVFVRMKRKISVQTRLNRALNELQEILTT